jgi:integrase/recombinase XerD
MSTTYYDEASRKVNGFKEMATQFMQRLVIEGKSKSTHENYLRQMAKMALHCGHTPLEMEADEIEKISTILLTRTQTA